MLDTCPTTIGRLVAYCEAKCVNTTRVVVSFLITSEASSGKDWIAWLIVPAVSVREPLLGFGQENKMLGLFNQVWPSKKRETMNQCI